MRFWDGNTALYWGLVGRKYLPCWAESRSDEAQYDEYKADLLRNRDTPGSPGSIQPLVIVHSTIKIMTFFIAYTESLTAGKTTHQSSTYNDNLIRFSSAKAVDENSEQCSKTKANGISWWRVDLGSDQVPVFEVRIINRFSSGEIVGQRNDNYKITFGEYSWGNVNQKTMKNTNYLVKKRIRKRRRTRTRRRTRRRSNNKWTRQFWTALRLWE